MQYVMSQQTKVNLMDLHIFGGNRFLAKQNISACYTPWRRGIPPCPIATQPAPFLSLARRDFLYMMNWEFEFAHPFLRMQKSPPGDHFLGEGSIPNCEGYEPMTKIEVVWQSYCSHHGKFNPKGRVIFPRFLGIPKQHRNFPNKTGHSRHSPTRQQKIGLRLWNPHPLKKNCRKFQHQPKKVHTSRQKIELQTNMLQHQKMSNPETTKHIPKS